MLQGRGTVAELETGQAREKVRPGIIGFAPQSLAEMRHGLPEFHLTGQRHPQIDMGFGVAGLAVQGFLAKPINITIDTDGSKYVTDTGRNQVLRFDRQDKFVRAYGVKGAPTSFLADRARRIRCCSVGYTTEWGLRARLWLAGR